MAPVKGQPGLSRLPHAAPELSVTMCISVTSRTAVPPTVLCISLSPNMTLTVSH